MAGSEAQEFNEPVPQTGREEEAMEPELREYDKRGFLRAAALAGIGSLVVATAGPIAFSRPAQAGHDGSDIFHLGGDINTFGRAVLHRAEPLLGVLEIKNTDSSSSSRAIVAESAGNFAVHATSSQTGVYGEGSLGVHGKGTVVGVQGFVGPLSGVTLGVEGFSSSTMGEGVRGSAPALSGPTRGVSGRVQSPDGVGVHGVNTAASGDAVGVMGHSQSPAGSGVMGLGFLAVAGTSTSPLPGATGVRGVATGPQPTFGVDGLVPSSQGTGVRGRAVSGIGDTFGVVGESESTSGTGVRGVAPSGAGSTRGVSGEVHSPDGIGVEGVNLAAGITRGVRGLASSVSGIGVDGEGGSVGVRGTGFLGLSGNGTNAGVQGESTSPGGVGVVGSAPFRGVFAHATGATGIGVEARADHYGLYGVALSAGGIGAVGEGQGAVGVGVDGLGPFRGMRALASGTGGIGIEASAPSGTGVKASGPVALEAIGKSKFSTVGNGQMPGGVLDHQVNDPKVGANTYVCVQLNSDPGKALFIRFIERLPGTGFIIHLEDKTKQAVDFSYWFADPV